MNAAITLKYEMNGDNINVGDEPEFPVEIEVRAHLVDYAKPSQRQIRLNSKPFIRPVRIQISLDDVESVQTFYSMLHKQIPNLPKHNMFFIFVDTQEWSGFVTNPEHVQYIASHHSTICLAIFNETYFERAIKLRNAPTIPQEMADFLKEPLPAPSQVSQIIQTMNEQRVTTHNRIINGATSGQFIDVQNMATSTLTIRVDDPHICLIPITPKFKPLLLGLNMALTAMDLHLYPRNRVININEELVKDIVINIIQQHSPSFSTEEYTDEYTDEGNYEEDDEGSSNE